MPTSDRIVLIGAGVMGEALLSGICANVGDRVEIGIVEPNMQRAEDIAQKYEVSNFSLEDAIAEPATFLIAVKPQQMDVLLGQLKDLPAGSLVISIAAGVMARTFTDALPGIDVIRAMPNTPARVGQGVTGISGEHASPDAVRWAAEIFGSVGDVVLLPETSLDALTAVSGSGPAYVFLLAEAMMQGAIKMGLTQEEAKSLVVGTVLGAGTLLSETGLDPGDLRQQVTSPGGTTQAALEVLNDRGFTDAVIAAMSAARDRSIELA